MANPLYDPPEVVAAWRERSRTRIGASEAGGAAGVDPYKTPLSIYCAKVCPVDDEASAAALWGLADEPAIARMYERETGEKLLDVQDRSHPKHAFMGASPDRIWAGNDNGKPRLVQIKSPSEYAPGWGESGTTQIPDVVMLQVQQEMEVFDLDACDVAARIGKTDLRIFTIKRDAALISPLIEIECELWGRIARKQPPEPDWNHPATFALIGKLNEPKNGLAIDLPEDCLPIVLALSEAKAAVKEHGEAADEMKARLIHAMGEASIGRVGGFELVRTKRHRKAYSVAETDYIDFRVKAPKSELVSER